MFFYTDGLIERRNRPIRDGLAMLATAVNAGHADQMCASEIAALLGDEAATDDVAVLAVRRVSESD